MKTLRPKAANKGVGISHGVKIPGAATARTSASAAKRRAVNSGKASDASKSPFPGFSRPTPHDVVRLHTALAKRFGERRPGARRPTRQILDTVVGTILSQNTTNTNSHRAFQQLLKRFGRRPWDAVRTASPASVASAIKCGGLAPTKTKWIQRILRVLHKERGKTSLEYLRRETKDAVHSELERFAGVGKKTSAIINLFDVGHPDMAVDTHVFRYAQQLGWLPSEKERMEHNRRSQDKRWPVVTRDTAYAHLDATFPDSLKYSMHLILTDTVGGLPVVCDSSKVLSFDGKTVRVDGTAIK